MPEHDPAVPATRARAALDGPPPVPRLRARRAHARRRRADRRRRTGSAAKPTRPIPTLPQPEDIFDLGDLQNLAAAPTSRPDQRAGQRRRHGGVRRAARRGRPGHDHRGGDDDRRGAGPAAGQGRRHARRRPAGAADEPAHRRLQLDAQHLHAGPHRGGDRPAAAGRRGRRAVGRAGVAADDVRRRRAPLRAAARRATARWRRPPRPRTTISVAATLKPRSEFKVLGTPQNRLDAHASVTGTQAVHPRPRRPGRAADDGRAGRRRSTAPPRSILNAAEVKAMPGITDVAAISHGVAVRGAHVRPVHRRDPRAQGDLGRRARSTASPTPPCSRSSRPPSCR